MMIDMMIYTKVDIMVDLIGCPMNKQNREGRSRCGIEGERQSDSKWGSRE